VSSNTPRAVFVTRETDFELLVARHGTREQSRFFLETRGQRLEDAERRERPQVRGEHHGPVVVREP